MLQYAQWGICIFKRRSKQTFTTVCCVVEMPVYFVFAREAMLRCNMHSGESLYLNGLSKLSQLCVAL